MSTLDEQVKSAEQEWLEAWKRGPQRLRWTEIPIQVGDKAPDLELADSDGRMVQLSSFWREKPALILFWRHYGCSCGFDRASMLKKDYEAFKDAGGEVLIIGQGEPERAAAYAKKYELPPISILSDPDFKAYEAYGVLEGKPSQILYGMSDGFLDRDYEAGVGLAEERRNLGRPVVDNSWLLPGEFVVDRGGTVRLTYRYNYCEDFPDHEVLTASIREAVLEGP